MSPRSTPTALALLSLSASVLAGCAGKDPACDSGACDSAIEADSGWAGATTIATLGWGCDDRGWWVDLLSEGPTGGATLSVYDADAALAEEHPFPETPYASDAGGTWENLYLTLSIAQDSDSAVSGESTGFACTDDNKAALSWVVVLLTPEGAEADCRAWGGSVDSVADAAGCASL